MLFLTFKDGFQYLNQFDILHPPICQCSTPFENRGPFPVLRLTSLIEFLKNSTSGFIHKVAIGESSIFVDHRELSERKTNFTLSWQNVG